MHESPEIFGQFVEHGHERLVQGGPGLGSMRKIEVKREVTELDLYELLLEGDSSNDSRLAHGDIIRVLPWDRW